MTKPSSDNEKRHFRRVPFISSVHISSDGQNWECGLLDISLKGLLIEPLQGIDMNEDRLYSITLTLSEEVAINMQAKVIHSEVTGIGLQWLNIDLESLTTLRHLLELNLHDPEEVNRELAQLIDSH